MVTPTLYNKLVTSRRGWGGTAA